MTKKVPTGLWDKFYMDDKDYRMIHVGLFTTQVMDLTTNTVAYIANYKLYQKSIWIPLYGGSDGKGKQGTDRPTGDI